MENEWSENSYYSKTGKAIILYIVLTYICNCLLGFALTTLKSEFLYANQGYICMYGPGISALIASCVYPNQPFRLGLRRCSSKFLILSIAIPILYILFSHVVYWGLFPESLHPVRLSAKTLLLLIPIDIFFAFGEEVGWRGFLAPIMTAKFGYGKASIFVGVIWGLWHNPFLFNDYYYNGAAVSFVIMTVTLTFVMNYLTLKSKSVWPAVMIHATHNFILFNVFNPITTGAQKYYMVGETGVITGAAIALLAIVFLVVNKKHPIEVTTAVNAAGTSNTDKMEPL